MRSKHVKVSQNMTRMIITSARGFLFCFCVFFFFFGGVVGAGWWGGVGGFVAIYIHPGLEHTTPPSTMLLQEEEVPFELEFPGTSAIKK